jgi:hypothetical protein
MRWQGGSSNGCCNRPSQKRKDLTPSARKVCGCHAVRSLPNRWVWHGDLDLVPVCVSIQDFQDCQFGQFGQFGCALLRGTSRQTSDHGLPSRVAVAGTHGASSPTLLRQATLLSQSAEEPVGEASAIIANHGGHYSTYFWATVGIWLPHK